VSLRGIEPPEDKELGAFWDGTRAQELRLPTCRSCGTTFWYPRITCPSCLSEDLDWRAAGGTGEVHAVSVMHRPEKYPVALVELDEGVRLMSNVVNVDPDDVHVGMRVRLTWEPLSDGRNLWLFEPAI
jgi:uncharacterized protein